MYLIRTLRLAILAVASLFYASSAAAHDGWVEVSPVIVEKNQLATIALLHGNHSNEHKSYRLAGKWDGKSTTLMIVDPQGSQSALTEQLIDFGEDDEKTGPKGPKGYHFAPFTPREEGLYQALAHQTRTVQHGDGPKLVAIRTGKTAFVAFRNPSVDKTHSLKGFDRAIGEANGLELIPINNPLAIFTGATVTFELRHNGKPSANRIVTLVPRIKSFAAGQEGTTDDNGKVTFTVGSMDSYLVRAKFEEEVPRADGQFDKNSYEGTYVFPVFNRP
jgi:uncharacterized GH25 family protein